MKAILLLFCFIYLPTLSFSQKTLTYWENGAKKSEGKLTNGKKEGIWEEWDKWGNLLSKGKYVNGVKEGKWEEELSYNVVYDSINFPTYYHDLRKIKVAGSGNYQNGMKEGIWRGEGSNWVKIYRTYHRDSLDGLMVEYTYESETKHPNFYPCIKGYFSKGNKVGKWYFLSNYLDENGINTPCAPDNSWPEYFSCTDFFYDIILTEGYFENDERSGTWIYWGMNIRDKKGPLLNLTDINLLKQETIDKFINDANENKRKIINGDTSNISTFNSDVSFGTAYFINGDFEGYFKVEKYDQRNCCNESDIIIGKYKNNKLDSILTIYHSYNEYDNSHVWQREINYVNGKKAGLFISSEQEDSSKLIPQSAILYDADTIIERHEYNFTDRGGQNLHLLIKYENGIPFLATLADSNGIETETVLRYLLSKDTFYTENKYDPASKKYIQVKNVGNVLKPSGEVLDFDIKGDTILHFIFFDSLMETSKYLHVETYGKTNFIFWPGMFAYDPGSMNFNICADNPDIRSKWPGYFPPGYFEFWENNYLIREVYETRINNMQYSYVKKWDGNKYIVNVSRDYRTNKPNVIEDQGKVYTSEGIYLFTPDAKKNH